MRRVIGLDMGEKRVGFAFANQLDLGSSMVLPGGFLAVHSLDRAVKQVAELIDEEDCDAVVIGLPLRGGQESAQTKKIRDFAEKLGAELKPEISIHFWDETLSSQSAGQALTEAGIKHTGKGKRGREDAVAAGMILQGFMDARRFHPGV